MRVTVGMVVGQIGAGHTINEILADFPYLRSAGLPLLRPSAYFAILKRPMFSTKLGVKRWRRGLSTPILPPLTIIGKRKEVGAGLFSEQ
jgi:hypothetical protein